MQTILITGTSSGYGLETARHFLDKGWNVIATMRRPHASLFPASARLRILRLDVTSDESIAATVAGWELVWPWPIGMGPSNDASSR